MTMYHNHQTGKRRVALAGGAVYCLTRAAAYLPNVRTEGIQEPLILASGGSSFIFGCYVAAWAAAGVLCLYHLRTGHLLWPMSFVAGMSAMWGASWGIGWLMNPDTLLWQTAFTYLGPAVMIASLVVLTPTHPAKGDRDD